MYVMDQRKFLRSYGEVEVLLAFERKGNLRACIFSVKYEAFEDEGVNRMWLCQ